MDKIKAVYLPYEMAYPMNLVADGDALRKAEGSAGLWRLCRIASAKRASASTLTPSPRPFDRDGQLHRLGYRVATL